MFDPCIILSTSCLYHRYTSVGCSTSRHLRETLRTKSKHEATKPQNFRSACVSVARKSLPSTEHLSFLIMSLVCLS